jgi:hypothetical protein
MEAERQKTLDEGLDLVEKYLQVSAEHNSDAVLVAAQLLVSTTAVNSKIPLQTLMDMLLKNMPVMYEVAVEKMFQQEKFQ